MSAKKTYSIDIPESKLPKHVAIIMDGNGRWAEQRNLPRFAGHKAGVETVRSVVQMSGELGIEALTLFAFSSENWRRPKKEVNLLLELFITALGREVKKLHESNVQLRLIGDMRPFPEKLRKRIEQSVEQTKNNTGLVLNIAANYGGKWDIAQAVQQLATQIEQGELTAADVSEETIQQYISLSDLPEPDLFIRTGGEQRISNFMIWQLAYTELYFSRVLWPDFDRDEYATALKSFASRQRRFGHTGQQILEMEQENRDHA